jgi:hypothetical protein
LSTDAYHQAAASIDRTNRRLIVIWARVATVVAIAAFGFMVWLSVTLANDVTLIKDRQVEYHCQTAAFDQVLNELAGAQQAQAQGRTPPVFVYPKQC